MAATVGRMTKSELKELIETITEQKLVEFFGDPDEGLLVRKSLRDRVLRQQRRVAAGERGEAIAEVIRRLGLE